MKLSSTRLPVAMLTGAILAFVHSTFAADSGDCLRSAATMAATTPAAGPHSQDQIAAASPALTLFIKAPTGDKLRLAYVPDEGWKFLEDPRGANVAAVAASASAMQATSAVEKPLTVFIDGPSGYTYVWMPDEGWKFVGHIIDQKR
jgi:hypothetical protein